MHHPTVLVVDDDENTLSAFKDFLKSENCRAITASSAEEASVHLEGTPVDLVITDVRLKSRSGVTFLMQLKADRQDLPVIVITGYPSLITEEDIRTFGADYFFLKPLELDRLRHAVRKCLHLNKENHTTHH